MAGQKAQSAVFAPLVPAIHVWLDMRQIVDVRAIRAFTPVFDGLWPGMTEELAS
jgi:hypothetical protein